MQTVKVVVCVREVRLVISKFLCLTKLVHPGTPEPACITGAPPPLPFERGVTGTQVPLHSTIISNSMIYQDEFENNL